MLGEAEVRAAGRGEDEPERQVERAGLVGGAACRLEPVGVVARESGGVDERSVAALGAVA